MEGLPAPFVCSPDAPQPWSIRHQLAAISHQQVIRQARMKAANAKQLVAWFSASPLLQPCFQNCSLGKALKLLEGSINAPLMQQPGLAVQFNVAAAKYKASRSKAFYLLVSLLLLLLSLSWVTLVKPKTRPKLFRLLQIYACKWQML